MIRNKQLKMIVSKSLINGLFQKNLKAVFKISKANVFNRSKIGNRDWVAFGSTGCANYIDDPAWPCPAVRFKENTNELLALREKEKGDWRKLTVDEKKTLYRASFRQTLEEVLAPTGEWKLILATTLILSGLTFWIALFIKLFVLKEPPKTFSEEHRRSMLRKMLDLKVGHITGISSKWDYEKDDWK